MDVLVSPGGQIQCRRRQVREQAWKDVVFKLERDRNFPPVFPRGDLHVEPAKRATLRQKERSAFRDELAWHATFMSIVVIEAGKCPMGILNAKRAGKSQEREVSEFEAAIVDLIRIAGEDDVAIDLVMNIVSIGEAKSRVGDPRQQVVIVAADIDALAAQLDEGRMAIIGPQERIFPDVVRSEEHTSELQSLMRISYAVFCLKKKKHTK